MGEKDLTIRVRGDVSLIDIKGDVTAQTAAPIEEAYRQASLAGAMKIVLCFDQTGYINSGGIGGLITVVAESRKKGQVVRMTGLTAHFQKIFTMVGLTKYAKTYPSEDAALKDF
jgi:anti-anti-sigma factor